MSVERLVSLRKKMDTLSRDAERAQGALDNVLVRLKRDFGVSSLKQGRRLLTKLKARLRKLEAKLESELTAFEHKWQDIL